ncbi:MAG TPA: biotin-dependent carboxyltransferase family protein [Jatrophihabitantaceae bacterium]|jgi:biotin-dependent carboxylase-like uncharacterized protein|nr:biotin-dependent carboxyltransferase family protein [Jatrophihabitantaceae bacterium]
MIEIVEPGPLATVQDLGRTGWASLGVPRSGAFDRSAARVANRLVGNPADSAVIEITYGGLAVRLPAAATLALTGAVCPGADFGVAFSVAAGRTVRLGAPGAGGLRSYLAVRGGVAVDAVLGSRSTDLLSGLGPARLHAGDRLPVGRAPAEAPSGATAALTRPPRPLRISLAPRADWFGLDAAGVLTSTAWTVRTDSDRIGVRLDGPALARTRDGELTSEPTLPGALQVPADGRPILLGPDAPVTGGYPVIAVLADADLDLAGQLRPGDTVTFRSGSGSG